MGTALLVIVASGVAFSLGFTTGVWLMLYDQQPPAPTEQDQESGEQTRVL